MIEIKTKTRILIVAGMALAVIVGGSIAWWATHRGPRMVYVSRGCGGYVPADSIKKHKPKNELLVKAMDAYNSGKYKKAESMALRIIDQSMGSSSPKVMKKSAQARYILAFSAARRKDMKLARKRFNDLRSNAAKLPDKGKRSALPGSAVPTLEEEGAYQHAVCTAALGDKEAAEAEYMKFMQDYPESPLINGAATRIEKLHNGHIPKAADDAWMKANAIAQKRQKAREKARNLEWAKCGPLCLAEILKRNGQTADVNTLAKELKTNENGTTMLAMDEVAKKHGLKAKGLALTSKGLAKQPLPLIAFVMPGHYVILEKVTKTDVTVWDPYGKGVDKPATNTYPMQRWNMMWRGVALVFVGE